MADNGFGNKANSFDFLLRAYFVRPDFKTAKGGTGTVDVGDFVQFRDPNGVIGFPIQTARSAADGRRRRPRVAAARQGRRPVDGRRVRPVDPPLRRDRRAARTAVPGPGRPRRLDERHRLPGVARQPVHLVAGRRDGGRQPRLRIDGSDARRQVPVRAARRRDGAGHEHRTAGTCWSSASADRAFTGRVWQYRTQPTVTGVQQCCFMADMCGPRPAPDGRDRAGQRPWRSRATVPGDLLERGLRDRPARRRIGRLSRQDPDHRPHRDRRPRPRLVAADPRR